VEEATERDLLRGAYELKEARCITVEMALVFFPKSDRRDVIRWSSTSTGEPHACSVTDRTLRVRCGGILWRRCRR